MVVPEDMQGAVDGQTGQLFFDRYAGLYRLNGRLLVPDVNISQHGFIALMEGEREDIGWDVLAQVGTIQLPDRVIIQKRQGNLSLAEPSAPKDQRNRRP